MTDKQIIIDGIDVSGCPYYCGHDICKNTCHYFSTPCEWVDVQNCTYKQLKRKEQECSEYSKELARFQQEVVPKLRKRLRTKEQECGELKEELNKKYIREGIKTYCPFFFRDTATCLGRDLNEIGQLKFCRKYHNCWIKKTAKENIQLKQTLTEIKEIAENATKCLYATYSDDYTEGYRWLGSIILQKISECEGNDE